jgi:hypothetical protein
MAMNKVIRWQSRPRWLDAIYNRAATQFRPALPVLRFLLTPIAVLAGALSIWRLAADAGWTNGFFIADGFLSHWQFWFAIAVGIQMSAWSLNRRVAVLERKV